MWIIIAYVVIPLIAGVIGFKCYRKCPADKIMVVFGGTPFGKGFSSRCIHGGGTFVWPLIQKFAFLDLNPMTLNVPLKDALTGKNEHVDAEAEFVIRISSDEDGMRNAADCLLDMSRGEIEKMAAKVIIGMFRLALASATVEEVMRNRMQMEFRILSMTRPELEKIGINLTRVTLNEYSVSGSENGEAAVTVENNV